MKEHFFALASALDQLAAKDEVITAYYEGEQSDFCRLNGAKVRQAGHVGQHTLHLRLVNGQRQMTSTLGLAGALENDKKQCERALRSMREVLPLLPEDPYLLIAREVNSTDHDPKSQLAPAQEVIESILKDGAGLDLVGIYAAGGVYRGFANTYGQRNWFASHAFNFDFSLYLHKDKAVKSGYAGFEWQPQTWRKELDKAKGQLEVLRQPPKTISPGQYRVFLAPAALEEILEVLSWSGFSLKAQNRKQSPLLKLVEGTERLSDSVQISEDIGGGISPNFDESGFIRPKSTPLIADGKLKGALTSARSGREFNVETNGANGRETPESLAMAGGTLAAADAVAKLGTGILVNNLWYLNFSDRNACRMTGMTRFATFWVENGKITAPLNVMRFDETLYRMLGSNLEGLTSDVAFVPSSQTYERRSTVSRRVPGALVDQFNFTL